MFQWRESNEKDPNLIHGVQGKMKLLNFGIFEKRGI